MSGESKLNKIFVGNVPFTCSREEFVNCFKNLNGFINADVKRRHNSDCTRGFGFVEFDNDCTAEELLSSEDDFVLGDRVLRFARYSKSNDSTNSNNCKVFINNIKIDIDSDHLKKILEENFGEVSSCHLSKRGDNLIGFATFKDNISYKKAINIQLEEFTINAYKKESKKNNLHNNDRLQTLYREGFTAGELVGYQNGYKDGVRDAKNGKLK